MKRHNNISENPVIKPGKEVGALKYKLETVRFGSIGVGSADQAYAVLIRLYPDIANKELAKEHIHRICKSHDEGIPFNLFENKRSFAIGGFGAPVYIAISKI